VYVKKAKKYSKTQLKQMSIILAFILLSMVVSIWLPIYFARLPMAGGSFVREGISVTVDPHGREMKTREQGGKPETNCAVNITAQFVLH
jgi:hypothetical protein